VIARFGIADTWIWASAGRSSRQSYDIHGLVTVVSDVPLPELERFAVPELATPAAIAVSIGPVGAGARARRPQLVSSSRDVFVYDEGLGRWGFAVEIRIGAQISITASRLLR